MDTASAHLARLGARSRPTGGAAVADARAYCADTLRALGFGISEHSFQYSAFPGAYAAPAFGLAIPTLATLAFATRHTAFASVAVAVAIVVIWLLIRFTGPRAVLDGPLMRRAGVNLQAVRGTEMPNVWLVAHLDSKWQPVSMIVRVAGVLALGVGLVALAFAVVVRPTVAPIALGLIGLGAIPLVLSVVGDGNDGTLDNASGVAAVLEAATLLPLDYPLGVLVADAEELALAGARAWARSRSPAIALNCDSVDDDGPLVVMYTRTKPARLTQALEGAAVKASEPLRTLRLIPGILTDSVALADAGWQSVTLSRGTIRTLQRIHTARDTLGGMRGTGIAGAARVLAGAATELSRTELS
ncbi:MAG TPA: M28 family peptidase [Gemmatimonadaceae bacterium]|nr:M28 family peptidase [Gemmatimonadaceae bacterium]